MTPPCSFIVPDKGTASVYQSSLPTFYLLFKHLLPFAVLNSTSPDLEDFSPPQPGYNTFAEIDTRALSENLRILRQQAGNIDIMAVVKADAYGHDVEQLVPQLDRAGIRRYMVATLDEALQLRRLTPEAQILVATPPHPENLAVYRDFNLDISITSAPLAGQVAAAAREGLRLRVHLKLETGMNRLGVPELEASDTLQLLLHTPGIEVAGFCSHLATATSPDKTFARSQISKAYAFIKHFPTFDGYFHIGNSGTLLNHRDRIGHRSKEFVRLGGAILGIPASEILARQIGLSPVMSLKSQIIQLKHLKPGDTVSYGRLFQATAPTQIAVVGAGYADGYPSALSGKARVRVGTRHYPIVGKICMDMFMIDLGDHAGGVQPGDQVELFGSTHTTLYDLARQAGLLHYEICCRIPLRVHRRFV